MKKLFPLLGLCFLFSCDENEGVQQTSGPKIVEAKGYVVPSDSMAEPAVIFVDESKLTKVPVGTPTVVPANLNMHPIGEPTVITAGVPRVCTPGKDTFLLPKVVPVTDSPFVAKQPKPTPALPLAVKDNATCNLQYLDVDQGMSSSRVISILEDKNGNLWFGTDGGGVSKYDGKFFTTYTVKEGLSNDYITSMLEDNIGNLWFGTYGGGVTKYDGKYFTHYGEKEGLVYTTIYSMLEDKSGNLWFGTDGGGVSKYDGKSFTHYTEKEGLSANIVRSILEDKDGNLWFGTFRGGVTKYDGNRFMHYTEMEGLGGKTVRSMLEDKAGNLWFGTNGNGVTKYDGKTFTHYTEKEGLSNNYVRDIAEDKRGNLWFGTEGGGVSKFDGNIFTHYTDAEGLSNNIVRSILEDKSGNLWFGTNGGGVARLDWKSFVHFTDRQGLTGNGIFSCAEDTGANIWFGTFNGGIAKYDGKSFAHYTMNEGLSADVILSILVDKTGSIWMGTHGGGVTKYDGRYFTYYSEKDGLGNNTVLTILEDKQGNIWFGTDGGGVTKFDGKYFTNYTEKEGLSSGYVRTIIEDRAGNLWFGTDGGGVTKYDGTTFTHFSEKEGLSSNVVLSIFEDTNGNIWFGTHSGGVSKYDGQSFTHYTDRDGLAGMTVWSIQEDKSNNLWMGTETGLTCFNIITNSVSCYYKEDGLIAEDFYQNSVLLDTKNQMWWGCGKSLMRLDLNNFNFNGLEPKILPNCFLLNESFVDYADNVQYKDSLGSHSDLDLSSVAYDSVIRFTNIPVHLRLPHDINYLTFYFSAIDWYAPHKIQYQYQLEGLDHEWSNLTPDNKADYRNIPHGNYTFKVRAIGSADKWSETFEYPFVIDPPWWFTWWAYTLYGIAVIVSVIGIVRWNSAKLRSRAKELKHKVDEATLEIRQQKDIVEGQKHVIEEKHKEITDSINYAERIQRALLASKKLLNENLREYFILFRPKDVVSGDFYWAHKLSNGQFALVCADSTGHGVPGAIMSILNISCLKEATLQGITSPDMLLNETRRLVIENLSHDGSQEGGKDGMDGSLLSFDFNSNRLTCACAHNPVWIVRGGEVFELKADRFPVGKHDRDQESFTLHNVDLQKGDIVYMFTDGFGDQFGGPSGKKFKNSQLKEKLLAMSADELNIQKEKLDELFDTWKGNLEQVDDVTVIGIKI